MLSRRMEEVAICDAFDWTHEIYMNQPNYFIDLKIGKRNIDNELSKKTSSR